MSPRSAVLSDANGEHPVEGVVAYDEERTSWVFRGKGADGTTYEIDLIKGRGTQTFTTPSGQVCHYTMAFDPQPLQAGSSGN